MNDFEIDTSWKRPLMHPIFVLFEFDLNFKRSSELNLFVV